MLFWKANRLTLPFLVRNQPCHWWGSHAKIGKIGSSCRFDAEKLKGGSDYEGLMKAIIDDQDPLTSGYKKNTLLLPTQETGLKRFQSTSRPWWASLRVIIILQVGGQKWSPSQQSHGHLWRTDGTTTLCLCRKSNQPSAPCPLLPLGNQCDLWQQVGQLDGLRSS